MSRTQFLLLLFFSLLASCSSDPGDQGQWQTISSRSFFKNVERTPLYRVKVPKHWERVNPGKEVSLDDSREALCTFFLGEHAIRITLHNFPSQTLAQRIAPQAQVARWRQQFNPKHFDHTMPLSFSGYVGLFYEGEGRVKGEETKVLGWALQIANEHYRTLSHESFHPEQRADVTIKITGPPHVVEREREALITFAESFELIEEIPSP